MTQRTAMNNDKRTEEGTTDYTLQFELRKLGYRRKDKQVCEACIEEMEYSMQSVGYTGTNPAWANPRCAYRFEKEGSSMIACRCGWRKTIV